MAKYLLGEVALRVANSVIEMFGAYSFSPEYRINHLLNLALLGRTGEGSANILRIALSNDALGFRRMDRHEAPKRVALGSR
jgi:glutaryl-CoA dehydrogenase (non-decarboxylating)